MISKGRKNGTVRFAYAPAGGEARSVEVAGDFNQWQPQSMRKQKSGQYVAICPVAKPVCQYKFLVDGQWVVDPDNTCKAPNPYGTFNSVVMVEA